MNVQLSVFFCDLLGSSARSAGGGGGDGRGCGGGGGGGGDGVEFVKSKPAALSGVCLLLWKGQYCQATHLSLSFIDSMFE